MTTKKNEIAVVKTDEFNALSATDPDLAIAMESLGQVGLEIGPGDLTRVGSPSGKATAWQIDHGDGTDETTKEIEGLLCYVQRYGVLWPSLDPQEGDLPVLRTFDMRTAVEVGPVPEEMQQHLEKCLISDEAGVRTYDWQKLPYTQFGSGKDGHGKRAKEGKELYVLRRGDNFPLIVRCGPGSIGKFDKFIKSVVMTKKTPIWQIILKMTLSTEKSAGGQPYPSMSFEHVGSLSKEDGLKVKKDFYDVFASGLAEQMALDSDVANDVGSAEDE